MMSPKLEASLQQIKHLIYNENDHSSKNGIRGLKKKEVLVYRGIQFDFVVHYMTVETDLTANPT